MTARLRTADDVFDIERFLFAVSQRTRNLSMRELAEQANISYGSLFRTFKDNVLTLDVAVRLADHTGLSLDGYRRNRVRHRQ